MSRLTDHDGIGFVICSRLGSSRLPNKAIANLNGKPLIYHLVKRCIATGFPVFLAVPNKDYEQYKFLREYFTEKDLKFHLGQAEDPLQRMNQCAIAHGLSTMIRVSHDKVFIEPLAIKTAVEKFKNERLLYLATKNAVDGSSFEVISETAIMLAAQKYHNVEFIGYAVKAVLEPRFCGEIDFSSVWKSDHRFLVDYPEDLQVLNMAFHSLGNDCSLSDAIKFLDRYHWISKKNRSPKITVYTCGYNAQKWLYKAMGSVSMQQGFGRMEYILIDDHSSDATPILMSKFASIYKNVKFVRNEQNMGLASSSNVALSLARGKYIVRLDADDYFVHDEVLDKLYNHIDGSQYDVVYPNNFFGDFKEVQSGSEHHHVGGAIFRTRAANHVKFTEGLRGYEGLDFFVRAKDQLKIGYWPYPAFFYRQHHESLTKNNLEERQKIKDRILSMGGYDVTGNQRK